MTPKEIYKLRGELKRLGVPSKSIKVLQTIKQNPELTTTGIAELLGISKQAVSKHVTPLEESNIITNNHPHPLYKAWTINSQRVAEILSELGSP